MPAIIGPSELIITPRGSIYHLDLLPTELADTIITVGDPGRVNEVTKYFDRIEAKAHHREFVSHTGYVGKKRITVIGTGIGPDNIDIALNEVDALANIDFEIRTIKPEFRKLTIIRLGTCGSLQADASVDSFIISSRGVGLDNLLHYYQHSNNDEETALLSELISHLNLPGAMITPYISSASGDLINSFGSDFVKGITVTCPGFYAPQGRVLRAPIMFTGLLESLASFRYKDERIINFEMETSAIYGLCRVLKHDCLSINTVVANRIAKTFSENHTAAIDKMIMKSLEIIENI